MQVLNSHPEYKVQCSNFIIEIETNAITVIHAIEFFLEIAFNWKLIECKSNSIE